jgi:hypothetical protein
MMCLRIGQFRARPRRACNRGVESFDLPHFAEDFKWRLGDTKPRSGEI